MGNNSFFFCILVCGALSTKGAFAVKCYVDTFSGVNHGFPLHFQGNNTETCAYCVRTVTKNTKDGITTQTENRECRSDGIAVTEGCSTSTINIENGVSTEITTCKCTQDFCNGDPSLVIDCYVGTTPHGSAWSPGPKITCMTGVCSKTITETTNGETKTVTETRGCGSRWQDEYSCGTFTQTGLSGGAQETSTICTCPKALCNAKTGNGPVSELENVNKATVLGCGDGALEGTVISAGCSKADFQEGDIETKVDVCFCNTDKCNDNASSMLEPSGLSTLVVIAVFKGIIAHLL